MWNYEIQLIKVVENVDDSGFLETIEEPQPPILAEKTSVYSQEYWQSNQFGVKLSTVFRVHSFEYNGEEKLIFNGEVYKIERTYEKDELIELVCSRIGDDHEL